MSQVVKREIHDASSPHRCTKGCRDVPVGLPLTGAKHRCGWSGVNPNGLQRVCQYRGHGYAACFPIFGVCCAYGERLPDEIDIGPCQAKQLRLTKTCVECGDDNGAQIGATACEQVGFFILGEEARAAVVFPKKPHLLHGILTGLAPFYSHGEHVFEKGKLPVDGHLTAAGLLAQPLVFFDEERADVCQTLPTKEWLERLKGHLMPFERLRPSIGLVVLQPLPSTTGLNQAATGDAVLISNMTPMPRLHTLHTSMSLPLPRDTVFAFFAEASNLQRITPPELGFEMVTPPPIDLREGTRIEYRLHLFGIPFVWQSEIQRWHPPEAFVDVQRRGPSKRWVHTHRFREEQGATIIEDEVQYALPCWPLGELVSPLVRLQLARIFRYRQQAIRRYLVEEPAQG
jgi:ligand-binding SRPBCC domain-containing protein